MHSFRNSPSTRGVIFCAISWLITQLAWIILSNWWSAVEIESYLHTVCLLLSKIEKIYDHNKPWCSKLWNKCLCNFFPSLKFISAFSSNIPELKTEHHILSYHYPSCVLTVYIFKPRTIGGTSRATFGIPTRWLNITIYSILCQIRF